MKKNILATFVVSATLLFTASNVAAAADGTVNFTGKIIDQACVVDLNGSGATSMNVPMGSVNKSAFTGVGSTAASTASATKFTIILKDCPSSVSTAKLKFDGISYSNDSTVLALTEETGKAEGVAIQLSDKKGVLPLYTESTGYALNTGTAALPNELEFFARYIQKEATVVAGHANAVATFTVNY